MRQLIVDPEFQKQIPPLTSEELDQLEKNILQEGQVKQHKTKCQRLQELLLIPEKNWLKKYVIHHLKKKRLLKNLLLHPHSQTQSRLNYLLSKSVQMHWQDLPHPMGTVSFLGPLHTCRRGRGRILGRVRSSKKEGLTSLREFMVCDKIQP